MSENKNIPVRSVAFILRALLAWIISAAVLLPIASLIVQKSNISAASLGYISSALSFSCAFFSGVSASRGEGSGTVYKGLISAAVITVILLTIGFLVEGNELKASAVLSLVSFSFSGCLLGSVMFPGCKTGKRKKKFHWKK